MVDKIGVKIKRGTYKRFFRLILEIPGELPKAFASLHQNCPNPFNPTTNIKYGLPVSGRVVIKVYDVIGQEIATLSDGVQEAGYKAVEWIACKYPSGVYMCRMNTYAEVKSVSFLKKLVLV